eukprot:m.710926 g.710926  ORF g.710926 m.710926 type:complete len:322 (+) comp22952_c0_seq44:1110-2075(+)
MFLRLSWTRVSTSQQQHVLRTLMTRATEPVVYLNGKVVPVEDAKVSVFDRGFLMADAVYEVTTVLGKKLVDFDGHVARLHRSMSELDMRSPFTHNTEILDIHRTLVERNNIIDGIVYTQVSRGADLKNYRSFLFPDDEEVTGSTVCMFGYNMPNIANFEANVRAMDVITVDDLRWGRRDIKTTQLLYPSLCKNAARAAGVDDAWMVDTDGFVTEGTSNNAYIVKDNEIITRHISSDILNGVTRNAVLRCAREFGLRVTERPFSVAEAQNADEAFVTSATTFVTPVATLDGVSIGSDNGNKGGPTAQMLLKLYIEECLKSAI